MAAERPPVQHSTFSAVDERELVDLLPFSPVDETELVDYLDLSAMGLAGIKHYAAAALAQGPRGPVVDIGCGAGHDLKMLAMHGREGVGVDVSATVLRVARRRGHRAVVRGGGQQLPFASGSFAGAHVERVLGHVEDPAEILAEAIRVLRKRGRLVVFEPDWSELRVSTSSGDRVPWLQLSRHPNVGREASAILTDLGIWVRDVVVETSFGRSFESFEAMIGLRRAVGRSVAAGRVTRDDADAWLDEIRGRGSAGEFRAQWTKVLTVAVRD